jgi:hypothetical protein
LRHFLFVLIFIAGFIYSEENEKPRKIYITISQSGEIREGLDQKDLQHIKNSVLWLLLKGKLGGQLSKENYVESFPEYLQSPLVRHQDSLIILHYGISVKKCADIAGNKVISSIDKCFPTIKEVSFFSDPQAATYLAELQILKEFSESEDIFWLNVGLPVHESKIPDSVSEEWDSLHQAIETKKIIAKYKYKKNLSIVLRKIEKSSPHVFSVTFDQEPISLLYRKIDNSMFELSSSGISLHSSKDKQANLKIVRLFLEIKTLNNRLFKMKPLQETGSMQYEFKGNISENDLSLLEKTATLKIEYENYSERRVQLIKKLPYQIVEDSPFSIDSVRFVFYTVGVTVSLLLVFFIIYRNISKKNKRKTTAIKIYKIDTESINAKRYRISEGEKISLGERTYKEKHCTILYDLGMEGHVIELLSARSNRFMYTNFNDSSTSREFVLPADIEVRNDRGKLIRVSIEILDKNNSFIISV